MEDFVIIGPRAKLMYKYTVFCEYKDENGQLELAPVASTLDTDCATFMLEELRSLQDEGKVVDLFVDEVIYTRNVEVNEAFFDAIGVDSLPFKVKVFDYETDKGRLAGVKR